ncbi:restriction endonuclease [Naumannella sp. ID2617S]|nr:restriction endonuclease [Naumannella sp. ID2617S]
MTETITDLVEAVGVKALSNVEVAHNGSNQHELHGLSKFRPVLGEPSKQSRLSTQFVWLDDSDEEPVLEDGFVTFYDARSGSRSELRLYYPASIQATKKMRRGDYVFLVKRRDERLLFIICAAESSFALQLDALFGTSVAADATNRSPSPQVLDRLPERPLSPSDLALLEVLGLRPIEPDDELLDGIRGQFGLQFPTTKVFSEYARGLCPAASPLDDPDGALLEWVTMEERLFRTLEHAIVELRLSEMYEGDVDVDEFVRFSLSVQNRRKSRAGKSLENHFDALLSAFGIRFENNAVTENRSRPDFLFPGQAEYHDPDFPDNLLAVVGVKTTCKDRWRQVLSEAAKISDPFLLTLESPISRAQTTEMRSNGLQLVVPSPLAVRYTPDQREWLLDISQLIESLRGREAGAAEWRAGR